MCGSNCISVGPPPDSILSMPPPPLPTFLLPRSAIVALSGNDSQPCFAAFMCEPTPGPREQPGIDYIEMSGKGLDDTWIFVLVSSCVGVLMLGALLAMILIKCRDTYNYSYQETSTKQPPMEAMCGGDIHTGTATIKPHHPFSTGNVLFPCTSNTQVIQQQMANDNRMLWAALTPHGTRHFMTEPYPIHDDHYEVIDYEVKHQPQHVQSSPTIKKTPIKSFDNSGFIDYDYEDPTPLIDAYNTDDMDSGYQEPHEIVGTLSRCSPRPLVSSPTRIEYPNIAPLNMHPHRNHTGTLGSMIGTMNKKTTLSRRISVESTSAAPSNI